MLDLESREDLLSHPKLGASFEGFALGAVVRHLGAEPGQIYFWGTQSGAELDLLVIQGGRRRGFEFKRADAPRLTPSMRIALADLRLDSLDVIYPGPDTYRPEKRVRVVPISRLGDELAR
jgi:predicted AAA+ superfamily ATPase